MRRHSFPLTMMILGEQLNLKRGFKTDAEKAGYGWFDLFMSRIVTYQKQNQKQYLLFKI